MHSIVKPTLVYLAAAVAFTWPLAARPAALLGAPIGPGDPYLNLWILGWGMQSWISGPAAIFTGRVFDANIFHPAAGTLAYSDHLLLQSGFMAPLYAMTGDVVLCYNVLFILSLVASALAMHLFVSRVVGTTAGAYLAGLVWGFGSYRFAHLLHLQLQALYFLPLTFLFLHRLIAARRKRDATVLGVLVALQAMSSVYYAVIGGIALIIAAVVLWLTASRRDFGQMAARLMLALGISGLLVLPVGVIYWRVQQQEGFGRSPFEASRNAASAESYVQVPPGNMLYGRSGLLRRGAHETRGGIPRSGPEREAFPGFVVLLLGLAGVWFGWRGDARPLALSAVAVATCGFVLSLGPDGFSSLYAALHGNVFGFQAIRAPARFSVLVTFGAATLAAVALRELSVRAHRVRAVPRAIVSVALMLATLECAHLPTAYAAAPPRQTDVGQWLRNAPGSGAVVVLPLQLDVESTPAMVQSLEHGRPLLNGYSGQRPPFYAPLVDTLSTFPAPEALVALHESDVQYVVTPAPVERPVDASAWPLVPRAQFGEGTVYELVWTPEVESRFTTLTTVVPPPVGGVPFAAGERATYTVTWDGAGVNLAAGTVTLSVEAPAYRLVATAETAPWVARFFEARDVFVTTTDRSLLPLVHERQLNEGSRRVTRVYTYDAAAGVVRTGDVTLPLTAGARDAIASIFYVRTQPLEPGRTFSFPVNEAGRNLVVDVRAAAKERLTVGEQQIETIRLEPRIRQRVQRRREVTATVWLSDDERRIPVVVTVDAGFGRVHLQLTGYQGGR